MFVEFLGGAQEVGKSAILVNTGKTRIMMDYGVKIQPEPAQFPPVPEKLDAAIPSHCHLDHSGALPLLAGMKIPFYMTKTTFELSKLLLRDFLKVTKLNEDPERFTKDDIAKFAKKTVVTDYNRMFNVKDASCTLYDAGHIPGASGILVKSNGKSLFYTGDTKFNEQMLVKGCSLPREKIDALIIESTYGDREHPDRNTQIRQFRAEIDETLNRGESVIVPVFAVGRSQEILLMLKDYANYIALDGMAKEATEIILRNKKFVNKHADLKKAFKNVKKIKGDLQRSRILKKPGIIVTTSGMLSGGPVSYYIRKMWQRRESRIIIVGFQAENTPGKHLLETGVFLSEGKALDVKCKISRYDFSSHAGKEELLKIVRKTRPGKVMCVHGDNCRSFAKTIKQSLGIPAYAPMNGEMMEI